VLPFTAVEIGVLAACLHYCVRRTHTIEVVRMTRDELVLERGIRRPTERWTFDRYFARFLVAPPRHPWYRTRVELKCREKALELGRFLSDEDKADLVQALRSMIRRLDQPEGAY
jgi:uncharacterized membrane protein